MDETIPGRGDLLKRSLAHVLWIGGPPDSGKTSVATRLAERYGLQAYHFDRHELEHFARLDPARHPALHAARPARMTPEQRWVAATPEVMARDTIASWTERAGMALDDLLALPKKPPILAEGPGFFPQVVAPLISSPRQAIWLVPTEAFKRASAIRRGKPGDRHLTSDPDRAQLNLIARDRVMGQHVLDRAREFGLTVIIVDEETALDQTVAQVEAHFAPFLGQERPGCPGPV